MSEDFRFRWGLDSAAQRDAIAVARSLELGTGLFSKLVSLSVFCPGCNACGKSHGRPIEAARTTDTRAPS